MDRYYAMTEDTAVTEIYDAEAYEKCKLIVALRNMGFTPKEIDSRNQWNYGYSAKVEFQHPNLMRRAEQVWMETAYRRFQQAKIRELEILASTVVPAVVLLGQVVECGAEFAPEEYQSRLKAPVAGQEVTLANRISAAKALLTFAQERLKAVTKEADSPIDKLPPLPKEFTERLSEAEDIALKLVPLAKKAGGA